MGDYTIAGQRVVADFDEFTANGRQGGGWGSGGGAGSGGGYDGGHYEEEGHYDEGELQQQYRY